MGSADPRKWAESKERKIARYARPELLALFRRARDVAMPGVPVAALIGSACNGDLDECTTGWISCSDRERAVALALGRKPLGGDPREGYGNVNSDDLHEVGPFGVEGGKVPDRVATGSCPWVSLADDEATRKILGRDAVTGSAWRGAFADQIALGVVNLARHGRQINARLAPALRWLEDGDVGPKVWSAYAFALANMGWSAGSGGASKHVNAYAAELAALPEAQRWGEFCRRAGAVNDPGYKHRADEWSALRTCQKIRAGVLACTTTGEDVAWFVDGLDGDREQVYAALVRAS